MPEQDPVSPGPGSPPGTAPGSAEHGTDDPFRLPAPPTPRSPRAGWPWPAFATPRSAAATMVAVAVVSALVAGGVGAAVGLREGHATLVAAGFGPVTNPAVSLPASGVGTPVASGSCAVPSIASRVVPSVVTISAVSATEMGTGAGVILTSNGYILTNNHVVAGVRGAVLTVNFSNGRLNVPAKVVGTSPLDDLAVVKVALTGLRAATLGRSASLVVGDPVVAVGAPLGFSGTVTSGIVSALHRNVEVPGATNPQAGVVLTNAIQTDAAINPGNSGGGLVDCLGDVVGINSAIASTGTNGASTQTGSIGVGFAIPIDYARSIAEQLIHTGHATHPYLGVLPDTLDPAQANRAGDPPGAYLRTVEAGTPASRAGLRVGDIITRFGTMAVTNADDLYAATRAYRPGQRVVVTYFRGGALHQVAVTLAQNPNG